MTVLPDYVSIPHIEQATINVLNTWLPIFLARTEEIDGLRPAEIPRPPTLDSIYGGVDFAAYTEDQMPALRVVVSPFGEPERSGSIGYSQWYEVQVGAFVMTETEADSRRIAGLYGAATMAAMLRGGYRDEPKVQDVEMVGAPTNSLPDEGQARLALTVTTFHVLIAPLIDNTGPAVAYPPDSPLYPGNPDSPWPSWPTVTSTHGTVTAEPL